MGIFDRRFVNVRQLIPGTYPKLTALKRMAVIMGGTIEYRLAEAQGVKDIYTVIAEPKTSLLTKDSIFRRESDFAWFKLTTNGLDITTPRYDTKLDLLQAAAEEYFPTESEINAEIMPEPLEPIDINVYTFHSQQGPAGPVYFYNGSLKQPAIFEMEADNFFLLVENDVRFPQGDLINPGMFVRRLDNAQGYEILEYSGQAQREGKNFYVFRITPHTFRPLASLNTYQTFKARLFFDAGSPFLSPIFDIVSLGTTNTYALTDYKGYTHTDGNIYDFAPGGFIRYESGKVWREILAVVQNTAFPDYRQITTQAHEPTAEQEEATIILS